MKRCLFYFKSLFLSFALLFFFSSFARAVTVNHPGLNVYADVSYADFVGSEHLTLIFRPIDTGLPYNVAIGIDVFRDGYFGILPLPADWFTLGTKTGCVSNVATDLWHFDSVPVPGSRRPRRISIYSNDNNGEVRLTRVSVNDISTSDVRFIRIYARVDLTYQTDWRVREYSDITFTPIDFHGCISPSGGLEAPVPSRVGEPTISPSGGIEAPVPPRIGERTDGPTAGDDCSGFMTVEEALRCRHGDLATPPAGGDSTTPPTTPGTTGSDITDTSNDSFGPPASVPKSPVSGAFFQGGGCSLGAGLPNSASSLAWVLFALLGGVGLFRIRQLKKN